MAHKRNRQAGDTEIVVTKEMIEAGLRVAWSAPDPPTFVARQVKRIYEEMERTRKSSKSRKKSAFPRVQSED